MTQVTLNELIKAAQKGALVSFPTDTVPALATIPLASELIFQAKQRSLDKPLILMAASIQDIWPYIQGTDKEIEIWQEVANKYWPGALTLVLPASDRIPPQMNPLDPTSIGVRVPNYSLSQKILAETGPLATTSANLSGQPPLQNMAEIEKQFPQALTLSVSELIETPAAGIPSTVAKWTGKDWQILRQGQVKL